MDILDPAARPARQNRWQVFSAAPHRMMLSGGALQLLLVMAFWFAELGYRQVAGASLPTTVPATWVHAILTLYGIFTFFMFGFLLTVYPRWLNTSPVSRGDYAPAFLLLAVGNVLFYIGVFASKLVVALAVALLLAGWAWAYQALVRFYLITLKREREHETILNLALAAGWLGLAGFLAAITFEMPALVAFAHTAGLWLFLVPVLFTVSHRMIPFFSSSALSRFRPYETVRPRWSLPVMLACCAGHAALELTGLARLTFLVDAPFLFAAAYLTIRWRFIESLPVRMLAMLHIAFLWLSIALALFILQSIALFATGTLILGRAPLHALGIGFFAGLSIAMVTRVTLGHSGNPLVANDLTWYSFLGLNAVAVLRVTAELPLPATTASLLNLAAAGAWLAVLLPWVAQYLPIYLRPRADGNPG